MTEPTRRPVPGDLVQVGDLPGVFRVLDRDGGLFVLESEHGTRCKAGVWVVSHADPEAAPTASIDGVNRAGPP